MRRSPRRASISRSRSEAKTRASRSRCAACRSHSAESYLARLIKAGHRVAIAEQTESPAEARKARGSKALVERAIIRLVTPGTLTEETLLELPASANWLAAIGRAGDDWAIAAADISTGRFELIACGPGELAAELARLVAGGR